MHQHQADAHAVEQGDVMDQRLRCAGFQYLAAKGDNEGTPAKGMDIRRGLAYPATSLASVSGCVLRVSNVI